MITTAVVISMGTSLFNEAAGAFSCSFTQNPASPGTCQAGINYDVSGSVGATTNASLHLLKLPTAGSGTISFQWVPIGSSASYASDLWNINVAFAPSPLQPAAGSGLLEYTLQLDPGFRDPAGAAGWGFKDEQLSLTHVNAARVVEAIYSDAGFSSLVSRQEVPTNPTGFSKGSAGLSQIWVRNRYEALELNEDESGIINNFQNSFRQQPAAQQPLGLGSPLLQQSPLNQAPGPLPLLGAGTAFGYSRRIRNRLRRGLAISPFGSC